MCVSVVEIFHLKKFSHFHDSIAVNEIYKYQFYDYTRIMRTLQK